MLGRTSENIVRVALDFQDEHVDLEVPDDRLIGEWRGPAGAARSEVKGLVLEALEQPRQYPPLRQAVVPGDRVVVALDSRVPDAVEVVHAVWLVLRDAGVESDAITVLSTSGPGEDLAGKLPEGVSWSRHDPDDRSRLAYLSSTSDGRRIYLDRLVTDADFVLPVGRLGYDPRLGYRGPWSTLYPGLGDVEAARSFRARISDERPDRERPRPTLAESAEVSWLLGCQFQVGIVEGVSGPAEVVAGLDAIVRDEGAAAVDRAWTFRPESRADLVVAGIGRPGKPAGLDELAEGLATAAQLVRHGGKVVALSRAEGEIGPALRRLMSVEDPRNGLAALRGLEDAADYTAAWLLARALAWADVYLLSALGQETVEDLSMIALERPEEARRLVAASASCLVVSQADMTRAEVAGEAS